MPDLPTGTVTFLYTDIEDSTIRWEQAPAAMRAAVARHDALIRQAIAEHDGQVFRTTGDGLCAAFAVAPDAVAAALAAQRALHAEAWGEVGPLRARMALHTGAAEMVDGDYVGPCLNRVARLLAAGHGGQALLSQATADLARDALPAGVSLRDLGEQRLRDLVRPERVYQPLHAALPGDFPPPRSLDAYPHNLPLQLTSFVGREREMAEVRRLLDTTRLLTLTGTGGCGKTRLALQVAADLVDASPDGAWLVELAPLADPDFVPQVIAVALGVREQPGQPILTTLLAWLKAKRLLLVLDNCEHLVEAAARTADALLRGCPGVRLLATSRELLAVPGEAVWRVPSLALPAPQTPPTVAGLAATEAGQLFLDRAQAVDATFALTPANAAAVAEICRRLDGIPLAIELAAARVRVLTAEQIAARLHDRFRLLTGGRRTAMRRQQTLAAAVDWSHDLLIESERVLLRRLAVFVGGWTLEAAEAVGGAAPLADGEVLDLLTGLADKSLVVAEAQREAARYRLLETVRQYAEDKLLAAGEAAAMRERHAEWCGALAARAAPEVGGPEQGAWFDQLEAEHDNLRAALGWRLGGPDGAAAGLALATDLADFWGLRGQGAEGIQWLEPFLAAMPARTAARARALLHLSELVRFNEGPARARPLDEEALDICREVGDAAGQATALAHLGILAATAGDLATARDRLAASLALTRAQGDGRLLAQRLRDLGLIHATGGDLEQARALFEESLALARATGATHSAGQALRRLGILDRLEGNYARARARLEEGLTLLEAVRFTSGVQLARTALANLARAEGRFDEAQAGLRAVLLDVMSGQGAGVPEQLVQVGILAVARGDHARGVRLIAVQVAHTGVLGTVHAPDVRLEGEAALARARAALGEAAFAAAWEAGQALTLDEAVAEALAEADGESVICAVCRMVRQASARRPMTRLGQATAKPVNGRTDGR